MNVLLRQVPGLGLLILAVATLGCGGDQGPKLAEVQGKVTYKGKAVPCGMVVFQTTDGTRGVGPIQADGSYSLKCPLGQVKAAVVTRPASPESVNDPNRPAVRDVVLPAGVDRKSLPPEKFESFETSGLSFEVKDGPQTINIPLD